MRADVTINVPRNYFHQMVKGWATWSSEQQAQYRRRHVKAMEQHFSAPGIRPSITLVDGDEPMVRMDVSKLPPVIQEHFYKRAQNDERADQDDVAMGPNVLPWFLLLLALLLLLLDQYLSA